MIEKYTSAVIQQKLDALNTQKTIAQTAAQTPTKMVDFENTAWKIKQQQLYKTFIFADFIQAFGFITQVAILAEKINHHPKWLNNYKKVEIYLTTHEVKGLSERDFQLANMIDKIIT